MGRKVFLILSRMKKGLSLENIANDLNISARQYSNYENGHTKKIPLEIKNKLSKLLDLDESLIDLEEGCIIISGNNVTSGNAGFNNVVNNYNSEILQKQLDDEKELNVRLREQIEMLQKQVNQLIEKNK
jgi:transcriptional regulator with XRE-family HTH domain